MGPYLYSTVAGQRERQRWGRARRQGAGQFAARWFWAERRHLRVVKLQQAWQRPSN